VKEILMRAKVIEVFSWGDSVYKVVYLVLKVIPIFRREASYPKLADTIK
jgi:hypothetical protein